MRPSTHANRYVILQFVSLLALVSACSNQVAGSDVSQAAMVGSIKAPKPRCMLVVRCGAE